MDVASLGNLNSLLPPARLARNSGVGPFPRPEQTSGAGTNGAASADGGIPFGLGRLEDQAIFSQALQLSTFRSEFEFSGNGFFARGVSETSNFSASIQQGNHLLQLNVEITRSTVGIAVGPGANPQSGGDFFEGLLDRLPTEARQRVEDILNGSVSADLFTPEATGNRIANFALGGFGFFEGGAAAAEGTAEARQRFADFILPAIEQGFEEALEILGELPDEILAGINQTRDVIDERFAAFLEAPADEEESPTVDEAQV